MRQIGAERLFALHQKIAWGAGPPSGFHRSRRRNGRTQSANGQRARPVLPPLCSDGRYGRHGPTELVADPTMISPTVWYPMICPSKPRIGHQTVGEIIVGSATSS